MPHINVLYGTQAASKDTLSILRAYGVSVTVLKIAVEGIVTRRIDAIGMIG